MATFLTLWESRRGIDARHAALVRQADINQDREFRACVTIQSIRRGILDRRKLKTQGRSLIDMQRIWRGYLGRQIASYTSLQRDKGRARQLWTRTATVLQKTFRGFYSRRYKHSYYERQAYLNMVNMKDQSIREFSEAVAEQTEEDREMTRVEGEQREFQKLAKDLHHLVSTSNTPGVFNSPYNIEPVRAFGAPVEAQLKTTFQNSKYLQRHVMRSLGSQRYNSQNPTRRMNSTGGFSATNSGQYTHSSFPRPLDTIGEEPGGRPGKRGSRVA